MGQGIIISNKGRGFYRVKIKKDVGNSELRISQIEQQIINNNIVIQRLSDSIQAIQEQVSSLFYEYLLVSEKYALGLATISEVINAKNAASKKQLEITTINAEISFIKLQNVSLTKEKTILEKAIADEEMNVWCIDYSLDLKIGKTVGLIECDGDFSWMNICSGGNTDDAIGIMQPVACSTPAGTFFNYAMMPCWQRWKPFYRAGIISSIDYKKGTCVVTLDNPKYSIATKLCRGMTSSGNYEDVEINQYTGDIEEQKTILYSVPMEYMESKADAFINGDHVIVYFRNNDWGTPLVIGFHDNPRPPLNMIQISVYNAMLSSEFASRLDYGIEILNSFLAYYNELITNFAPAVIAELLTLEGNVKSFAMAGGIPCIYEVWTLDDIKELQSFWQEMIGLPTEYDERRWFPVNAVEARASLIQRINTMTTLKSLQNVIFQNIRISFTGHQHVSLGIENKTLNEAVLNFEILKIKDDTKKILNPSGISDWMKKRNQSIRAEELWKKYANEPIYCNVARDTGWISNDAGDVKVGEVLKVVMISEEEFPNELIADGHYIVGQVMTDSTHKQYFRLLNGEGTIITRYTFDNEELFYGRLIAMSVSKAPILKLRLECLYLSYNMVTVEAECIGLIDADNNFIIITRNPTMSSDVIELSTSASQIVLYLWLDGKTRQPMITYPTNLQYGALHWNVSAMDYGDEMNLKMAMSYDGRMIDEAESFGGHFEIKKYDYSLYGEPIVKWWPEWYAEPKSFMTWYLISEQEYSSLWKYLPNGLFMFASFYFDHPIVTGIDNEYYNPSLTSEQQDAIVSWVNSYVNTSFTYRKDLGEDWTIMGQSRTYGDCEDFALTKIDMCLKMGISIKRLKFAYGYPGIKANGSGHAWVIYNNTHVLDIGTSAFKTQDMMIAAGYIRLGGQIGGLKWWYDDTRDSDANGAYTEVVLPRERLWGFTLMSSDILSADVKLTKRTR